jgi:hypothetical protein
MWKAYGIQSKIFNLGIASSRICWITQYRVKIPFPFPSLLQGDVAIDIGAHLGLFAAHIAQMYPEAVVYSLEPLPRNFKYLFMNLQRANLLSRVTPINLALGFPLP